MRYSLLVLFSLFSLLTLPLSGFAAPPNFAAIHDYKVRKQTFIKYMLPYAQQANADVAKQHQLLSKLYKEWQVNKPLKSAQIAWVVDLARQYQLNSFHPEQKASWRALLKRVDIVPVSMLLAQSANESSWGSSRFAQQGRNYFGQWCFSQGCGIVPARRTKGAHYEVRKFPTVVASIESYIHNLNTNSSYRLFRDLRYQMRQHNKPLAGMTLAQGLKYYSTRREAYVVSIRTIITANHLTRYDLA